MEDVDYCIGQAISIHAPRTGSDRSDASPIDSLIFQSTLPARGATVIRLAVSQWLAISIHAPRTGSDTMLAFFQILVSDFNPRSPHGERPLPFLRRVDADDFNPRSPHGERREGAGSPCEGLIFQSTLPARGATRPFRRPRPNREISIHAPRTGSDCVGGDATDEEEISIHAPRTGSDWAVMPPITVAVYFNPRSPHGERQNAASVMPT